MLGTSGCPLITSEHQDWAQTELSNGLMQTGMGSSEDTAAQPSPAPAAALCPSGLGKQRLESFENTARVSCVNI